MSERGLRLERLDLRGRRPARCSPASRCQVEPGEVVTVMGPSGCGKSSLLSYLCGTLDPVFRAAGRIWLNGVAIEGCRRSGAGSASCFRTTCCFRICRSARTWPSPCRARCGPRASAGARVEAALREAGLDGFAAARSGDLVGRPAGARRADAHPAGRAARAAAGRALQQAGPAIFASGCAASCSTTRGDPALPTLLVTHDPADAEAAGGPVIGLPDEPAAAASCRGTSAVVDWRERRRMLWSGVARRGHVLRITGTSDRT